MAERRSIDPLLSRTPNESYNCLDFVIEAWAHISGDASAGDRLRKLSEGVHAEDGKVVLSGVRGFSKLADPFSPCFVVMQRSKTQPHIGIYYQGRVLHMKETGVEFQPVAVVRRYFTKIGYYSYAN
jgi:hypothetical protein